MDPNKPRSVNVKAKKKTLKKNGGNKINCYIRSTN